MLCAFIFTYVAASTYDCRAGEPVAADDKQPSEVVVVTSKNFDDLVAQGVPLVVDFYVTWCDPCDRMEPIVESLAKEYKGRVIVGKCNVVDSEELATMFLIRNVPTILFIKSGKLVDKQVGVTDEAKLRSKIEQLIK
mgnify:CR=1 FL=1